MTRAEITLLAEEIVRIMKRDGLAEEYLTSDEAAKFLGISKRTLYNNRKNLPCANNGRKLMFRKSELVRMLNN